MFAYLRRRRSIETLAETTQPEKLALATLVRVQGHSVRELEGVVRAADARWLREFKARTDETLDAATLAELPDWLWQRLGAAYGDDARAALARALLAGATLDLRVNPLRVTREAVRAALAADGIVAVPTPWSPLGLRVQGRPSLARHPLLQDGSIEIQDEGSQLRRLPGRAQAQRDGRRLLRRRRRQDAAPGRADALAGPALRVRHRRQAARAT